MTKETGGPAFPQKTDMTLSYSGMTLRQYAAIKLKVPDSGTDWLDDMIAKSLRDDFAAKAMQSYLSGDDRDSFSYDEWARASYQMADSLLEARSNT